MLLLACYRAQVQLAKCSLRSKLMMNGRRRVVPKIDVGMRRRSRRLVYVEVESRTGEVAVEAHSIQFIQFQGSRSN